MSDGHDPERARRSGALSRRQVLTLLGLAPLAAMIRPGDSRSTALATRPIPASGERIPVIGLGTWETFDIGSSDAALRALQDVLAAFSAAGGRLVDSSPMYGRAESVLGELLSRLGIRPSLILADKVWTSGRAAGVAQMEESLRRLRTPSIDLMQVHNLVDVGEHLPTLREWKRRGLVRYIGVTHYHSGAHAEVERVLRRESLDFLQINYSILEPEAGARLIPLAADRGVAVIANRPFAGGDFFRATRGRPLPALAAEIGCRTWAEMALKWILGDPLVTAAIPATDRLDHLADNLAGGRGAFPSPDLRRRISAAARTA